MIAMDENRNLISLIKNEEWLQRIDYDNAIIQGRGYLVGKRIFDLALVLLSSPFWLFLIVVIASITKLTDPEGPVIFSQCRTGQGGKRFKMYKFRTMVHNAEELKEKYKDLNELQWPDFKITNDPRITKFGNFLRKSSLDEIPQLFNVFKGEMSLVGPRPTSFSVETYCLWQTERLDVLPGLTGLWQIYGRATTEFDDRLRLDILYINKRCMRLDLEILARTIFAVLNRKGAV